MAWREESIVSQRLEFVTLAGVEGANIRELCRGFRISRQTGYKWIRRHREGGVEALKDLSRRPRSSPGRSDRCTEDAVVKLRERHPAWGARKLRTVLLNRGVQMPAASTIHAILVRQGCVDPARSEKHQAWTRFEHDRPNAMWQMDFKGHVPMHRGGRCHPLTILDDHSRFSIGVWACANEQLVTVQARLIEAFRRFGLPERLLCDNGSPWTLPGMSERHTRLTAWLLRLGVVTVHGRAFHPQTQGKEERFHRTLKAELLSRTDLHDLSHAQEAFDEWRGIYNLVRPHEALGMAVPASCFTASTRPYPERLPEVQYAPGEVLRRVRGDGTIKYAGGFVRVGSAFSGEWVALRPRAGRDTLEIYYGPHPVGQTKPDGEEP
jgi:transposase InsO family protein